MAIGDEGFATPWVEFEKLLGLRPMLYGPSVDKLNEEYAALGGKMLAKITEFPVPDASIKTEDLTIGNGIKIRVYTPPDLVKGSTAAGLFIHGGGWAMGDLESDDPTCREISKRNKTVVVSVDYRLAPQNPYPAGLNDCAEAFTWTVQNAERLGCVPGKAFIAGGSAGGGSAFGLALRLVDAGKSNQVVGIVSQVPCLIHPDLVPEHLKKKYTAYDENAENTINTKGAMYGFWAAYGAPKGDIYANPLLHPGLKKLPRVYITGCDKDTLRDDARLMVEALKEAGVPVKFDEWAGYPHYFWTFPAPSLKEVSKEYYTKLSQGLDFVVSKL